ncbi:phosphatidate phosphatase LPIN3 isoform X2 [Homalodisca vitripennis]|uniref:phosphatidate phosphatase LPIN3 isoform X2 n=1 Tax=Homalodisca vitripennis TaxID=197043 RepID=UPI001EEB36F1|nr:phosphatidate phosphatase LPIN3 isoform X2 [Homalodisca vitripennis]
MHSMNYLGKFISNFRYVYNEINAATLTGAIDVVVVEQPDGTFTCSPFHVRFGKIGVLRSREKVVDIEINGEPVDIHMKLGESGEAFFVEEVPVDELGDELIPPHLACSPIPREGSFHERYLLKDDSLTESGNHWDQRFEDRATDDERLKNEGDPELSGTPKIVVAGGGSVVKTFKAETVERESGRKLSAASADFKPIERESESSTDSIPSKGLSGLDLNKDDDSPLSERVSTSLPGNKRKRRKKSLLKKKTNNGAQRRNSNIDVADISNEPKKDQPDFDSIFQIEDLGPDQKPVTTSSSTVEVPDNSNIEELAHIKDAPVESDIHFFSDTELTPGCSPHDNRQFTPVQSDTEFEIKRGVSEGDECKVGEQSHQQSWRWGELPTSTLEDATKEEAQRSMLHNMLGFMKKTKHIRHNPSQAQDGIYLSDINVEDLDPEVAALYFPTNYKQAHPPTEIKGKDEDTESGNGPSLPHSPHSVEGAIGGPKSVDSDFEEPKKSYGEISMSLCGGLTTTSTPSEEAFLHHIITYDEFVANPTLITSPNLVVRIDGKMLNWRTASPVIMALAAFQKPLPQEVVSSLCAEFTPPGVSVTDQRHSRRSYSSWFTWGVRAPQAEPVDGKLDDQRLMDQTAVDSAVAPTTTASATAVVSVTSSLDAGKDKESDEIPKPDTDPFLDDKVFATGDQGTNSSDSDSENERKRLKSQSLSIPLSKDGRFSLGSDKFRKTLRLTSEQIASLNLRDGANEIVFSVTTAYQGTSRCKCFLFKWRYDDKIVVSDIDGTITKSDVLGHILPIVGKDWAQSGVAKLFTKIKDNGYKLLYLSARAIGQSRLTRDYLKSIKQEDLSLPEGPMLLNPTSLLNALHTEVIEKKPEEFKISCLRDIQALFPAHCQPFYAGYGNKINDVWAYQAVGIPIVRIFTINHRGELKHELTQTFQSSYSNMTYIVDQMFPTKQDGGALLDDFSQFVYWREPIPEMDLPAL